MLQNIRIVLVETSHPGNIGAVARAMKNMCLADLALVAPREFPSAEATSRASGADDLLAAATVVDSLDEAIADCQLVVGASARLRTVSVPQFPPRECAAEALKSAAQGRKVAILFGRENSGLTNAELGRCHQLVHIPANSDYSSLNIAMAVQVICYELLLGSGQAPLIEPDAREPVTAREMQGLFEHLEQAMVDVGFSDPRQSEKLMLRLRRLFFRAEPDGDDIRILRGILSAAQGRKSMRR
jgi:tRNA (cytidine32/uridine32-2'-O)-methyltransferase